MNVIRLKLIINVFNPYLKKLIYPKGCRYIDISPNFKKNPAKSNNGILNAGIKKVPI